MIGAGLLQAANPVVEDLDVTGSRRVNQELAGLDGLSNTCTHASLLAVRAFSRV